jgi:hypothetical protein
MAKRSSSTSSIASVLGTIALIIIALVGRFVFGIGGSSDTTDTGSNSIEITSAPGSNSDSGSSGGTSPKGLPSQSYKQTAQEITFHSCPPEGDGGDPVLNKNKNRVDVGRFQPTAFNTILNLPWPSDTNKKPHADWPAASAQQVAGPEGLPVAVEGYLALARQEGPETPNCHSSTDEDFHIWLIDHPGGSADRVSAVVVEATPRVRANHSSWTVSQLNKLATAGTKVRISGWLMLDPEHPEQLQQTRGTLWEIHPIIKIDVYQGGTWVSLDNLGS